MRTFTQVALTSLASSTLAKYYSGEVKTKETYQYGKFRTSMQSQNHYGTVASFFTYWDGPNWNVGGWNEIDVEIVPSVQGWGQSPFSTNIIYGDGNNYNIQE